MLRWRAALLVALVFPSLIPAPRASAQSPSQTARIRLIEQPLWHRPGQSLGLKLRIENVSPTTLDGFIISIDGHQRAVSRSALHEALQGNAGFSASSFSDFSGREDELAPGQGKTVRIQEPVSDLASLATANEGGVYPVTVSLFDSSGGTILDSLTTPLIYYPTPPEIPLGLVLAIPLNEIPARGPDGVFEPDPLTGTWKLEDGLKDTGWLTGLIAAMKDTLVPQPVEETGRRRKGRARGRREKPPAPTPPLNVTLAPTPRFIEELADMANGYRRDADGGPQSVPRVDARAREAAAAIAALRELLQLPTVQPALVPYSFPDLPTLEDGLDLERGLAPQLREARTVLGEVLDTEVNARWLFPPAGRMDTTTISGLRAGSESFRHAFFAEESFDAPIDTPPPGCPSPSPSFTCPVIARTQEGPVTGLITDAGLQDRLGRLAQEGEDRLDLQGFFAETAMIREEIPGVEGRVVQTTIPSLWHTDPATYNFLLEGIRDAPWLRTLTPDQAMAGREKGRRTLLTALQPLRSEPDEDLFGNITAAQQLVEDFELIRPPPSLTQLLHRNLLLAQSRLWGQDEPLTNRAEEYVSETSNATLSEFGKIRIGGIDEIRLTSQHGEVPVEIFNDADYAVNVIIHILSTDLRVDRTIPQNLQPGRFQQLTVDIRAGSSGIFPLEVAVETPDGSYEIDKRSITVRSTEFNQVALLITLGALGFLVFFFLLRGIRRRRGPDEVAA